jgi:hypothetical protein
LNCWPARFCPESPEGSWGSAHWWAGHRVQARELPTQTLFAQERVLGDGDPDPIGTNRLLDDLKEEMAGDS